MLTNHHILLDGWSMPVLMRELLTLYAHGGDAGVLPRVTPYRNYLAWLAAAGSGGCDCGLAGGVGGAGGGHASGAA